MTTTSLDASAAAAAIAPAPTTMPDSPRAKWRALFELTKPRIALLVLITVAIGYLLGARGAADPLQMFLAVIGTWIVAGVASVWNQILERHRDARMKRTCRRPLPSGRVQPWEAATFATAMLAVGLGMLLLGPYPLAAALAAATFGLYVAVYTPSKPYTTLNTAIGAIPGALPPVIGWVAATGELSIEAWALFLVMFLWQFPQFLAIAWLCREDYARGGFRMLPSVDPSGAMTGRQAVVHALALVPVALLPTAIGMAGPVYFAGALVVGLYYLAASVRFYRDVNETTARKLLKASIIHLPLTLGLLLVNPLPA